MDPLLHRLLLSWAGAAVWMLLLWAVQRRTGNAGVVDFGWAASVGAMAVYQALAGGGDPLVRLLVGLMGGLWGVRLSWHLLRDRVWGQEEEGRYVHLRRHWGARADLHFLWFFQSQAAAAVLLSLPFALAARRTDGPGPLDLIALLLFAGAWVGEAVADAQLRAFKRDPDSRGRTCRRGLWRYSRHPNYFFEWLMWVAFALPALPAAHGPWALSAPVILLVLVTRVTGIPPTEAQALRSRGEDYRRYQQETSAFFPWFPKREVT